METFTQIIFPPTEKKPDDDDISYGWKDYDEKNYRLFDAWVVGRVTTKVLMVKCPACGFTYELMPVDDEAKIKKELDDFGIYYFKRTINECPERKKHRTEYDSHI